MTDQTPQKTTEPVAYCNTEHLGRIKRESAFGGEASSTIYGYPCGAYRTPLYTTPQPLAVGLDRARLVDLIDNDPAYMSNVMDENRIWLAGILADAILALAAPADGWQTAALRLCTAADEYGVRFLDSDDMSDEAVELQDATIAMRDMIAACLPAAPTGETGA